MLKWIRLTALVAAGAVMTLGCVRGLAAPTAAIEAQTSTVKKWCFRHPVLLRRHR